MLKSVWKTLIEVLWHWTTVAGVVFTVLGLVQELEWAELRSPPWAWWLGAIALLFATACRLQLRLDAALNDLPPKRDTPFQHAVFRALHGQWPETEKPFVKIILHAGDVEKGSRILGELRRQARDGDLQVWGQEWYSGSSFDENGVLPALAQEHWQDFEFDLSCLLGEKAEDVRTDHSRSVQWRGLGLHCGLMVNRRQIEELWPASRRRVTFQLPWRLAEVRRSSA